MREGVLWMSGGRAFWAEGLASAKALGWAQVWCGEQWEDQGTGLELAKGREY